MELEKRLVEYIVDAKYEDLPKQDVDIAKNMVLTEMGTIIAGASVEGCETLVHLVKGWGGKEEATILMYGGKVPAPNAVLVNSTMARALDIDDSMAPGMHVGASSVPTAIAAAELAGGCTGKEFLAAIAIGQDIAARINIATTYEGFEPIWDPTGVCGIFASTVAAGRILRFDSAQMWNALGLTFTQPAQSAQAIVDGSVAFRLFQGFVSRNSMMSVQLAQKGFTGPKNFLQGPWGYFRLYSKDKYDPEILVRDLGRRFELGNTMFKSYPSCGATIASTDAILYLITEKELNPDNVARIAVKVTPFCYKLVGRQFELGENPTINAQFSIQYCVANALLRQGSALKHFTASYVKDPKIMELINKIYVTPDPTLDSGRMEFSLRVDMEVTTTAGNVYRRVVDIPSGFPGNPLKPGEHVERFRDAAAYGGKFPEEKLERIISTVYHLEELKDIRALILLLSCQG
jgi:2-methylcitrate dehydratase PrpD